MASKTELGGGLNALFGGSKPQSEPEIQKQQNEDPESKAPQMEVEPTTRQDEEDLINSVEDEELRAKLRARRMDGRGRPRKNHDKNGKRTDGYSRTSLIVNDEKAAKIKEIAFRETLTMKEIFELALDMVIEKYESTHGVVVPRPERYKGDINSIFDKK